MGSDAQVIVVGGNPRLEQLAQDRIADLEHRWSRFVDSSEVSALNRFAGSPVKVSRETVELVRRSIDAWHLTNGRFDPTVLGAVIRAGYDRTFDAMESDTHDGSSDLEIGIHAIEILDDIVRLPHGTGFDPGGIGKGLAADIVTDELIAAGAQGACVNLGGDMRVFGTSPRDDVWTVAVDHPLSTDPVALLGLAKGAVATSTTLRRRWLVNGEVCHHLIDPTTGEPSASNVNLVTVVSGCAWAAEVMAKAVLLRGTPIHFDLLATTGAEGIAIDSEGGVHATAGISAYVAAPGLPPRIEMVRRRERTSA
jgi:thiamine biosynthesis lipoprotein